MIDRYDADLRGERSEVSSGLLAGDALSVAGTTSGTVNGITWGYANGVLSFNGSSSLANYQTLLDQVQYASSSQNPTNFGADTSRSISWVVNDGTVNSSQASTTSHYYTGRSGAGARQCRQYDWLYRAAGGCAGD